MSGSALLPAALLFLLVGFFAMLISAGVVQVQFILRLRRNHSDIWRDLGQPPVLFFPGSSNRWTSSWRLNHYLHAREFQSISDPGTRRLAERLWRVRRMFLGYTIIGSALVLVLIGFANGRAV
jgi:hypothetical protein